MAAALALDVIDCTVARVSAVKKSETKEMTLATAGFVSQDMLTHPFFLPDPFFLHFFLSHDSKQKVRFLITRSIIDELASRALERAIRKRNETEHRYTSPTLEIAEDVVELIRRTLSAIRTPRKSKTRLWNELGRRHSYSETTILLRRPELGS